jgi:hypothetical protein
MKSIFKLLTVVLISVLLASCGAGVDGVDGSSSTAGLVGQWKADLSSFDLILGDGVPAEMKGMVEMQKDGLLEEGKAQSDDFTIEFTDAGKMVVSKKGDDKTEELDYNFDGNKLALSGEVEGDKVNINLNISEVTADKFTIALTGEEVLAQIKAEYPELLASAGEVDVDAMVKGCSVTLSFKK